MGILYIAKLIDFSKVTQLIEQQSQDWNQISLFPIQFPFSSITLLVSQCLISKSPCFRKLKDTTLRIWLWKKVSSALSDSPEESQISPSA